MTKADLAAATLIYIAGVAGGYLLACRNIAHSGWIPFYGHVLSEHVQSLRRKYSETHD